MFGGKGRFSSGPSTPPKLVRDHRDRPKKNWRELRLGDHPLKRIELSLSLSLSLALPSRTSRRGAAEGLNRIRESFPFLDGET